MCAMAFSSEKPFFFWYNPFTTTLQNKPYLVLPIRCIIGSGKMGAGGSRGVGRLDRFFSSFYLLGVGVHACLS